MKGVRAILKIQNSIKKIFALTMGIYLIFTNNLNSAFACGSLEGIEKEITNVNGFIDKAKGILDESGKGNPLEFACCLNKNLVEKFISLITYCNTIQNNLEALRADMGDELFDELLGPNAIRENLKEFIGYEPGKERKIGKAEKAYLSIFEETGINPASFISQYQAQLSKCKICDEEYLKAKKAADVTREEKGKLDKAQKEKDKAKAEKNKMCEGLKQAYCTFYSKVEDTIKIAAKDINQILEMGQNQLFKLLDSLDAYEGTAAMSGEIAKCKEIHKMQKEDEIKLRKKQNWQENKLILLSKKLIGLLKVIEEGLAKNTQNLRTVLGCIDRFSFLDWLTYSIADISYVTNPGAVQDILNDFVFFEPQQEVPPIIEIQRKIGMVQTELSILREPILRLLMVEIPYTDATIPTSLHNAINTLGIHEKLYTYSLNQYHNVGKNKAHIVWERLGFNREDVGILEARLRHVLTKTQAIKTIGKKKEDNKFGEKYTVKPIISGLNFENCELETAWIYKKDEGTGRLNGLPECITLF